MDDPLVELPRPLDLRRPADIDLLSNSLLKSGLGALAAEVPTYLRFFPGAVWTNVTAASHLELRSHAGRPEPFDITYLLRLASYLRELEGCPGFGALHRGILNVPQFRSAAFEAQVAHWCLRRPGTRSVAFELPASSGQKRFDFTWVTAAAEIRCECKRAEIFENLLTRRLEFLASTMDEIYLELEGWRPDLRVDLRVRALPSAFRSRLRAVLAAWKAPPPGFRAGLQHEEADFSLSVRSRAEALPLPMTSWRVIGTEIGSGVEVPVSDPHAAHFTVEFEAGRYLRRTARQLLQEARVQLPADLPGLVLLQLWGAPVTSEVERLLSLTSFSNIAGVAMWGRDHPVAVVYRRGQPFDGALLMSNPGQGE